jgi:hypothetical protein
MAQNLATPSRLREIAILSPHSKPVALYHSSCQGDMPILLSPAIWRSGNRHVSPISAKSLRNSIALRV